MLYEQINKQKRPGPCLAGEYEANPYANVWRENKKHLTSAVYLYSTPTIVHVSPVQWQTAVCMWPHHMLISDHNWPSPWQMTTYKTRTVLKYSFSLDSCRIHVYDLTFYVARSALHQKDLVLSFVYAYINHRNKHYKLTIYAGLKRSVNNIDWS